MQCSDDSTLRWYTAQVRWLCATTAQSYGNAGFIFIFTRAICIDCDDDIGGVGSGSAGAVSRGAAVPRQTGTDSGGAFRVRCVLYVCCVCTHDQLWNVYVHELHEAVEGGE